jgi:hypothetical protein
MSEAHVATEDPRLEALHKRMAEHSLGGHWQTRVRAAPLKPFLWPWSVIRRGGQVRPYR